MWKLAVGLLLVFYNVVISFQGVILNVVPSFVGYFLISVGLSKEKCPSCGATRTLAGVFMAADLILCGLLLGGHLFVLNLAFPMALIATFWLAKCLRELSPGRWAGRLRVSWSVWMGAIVVSLLLIFVYPPSARAAKLLTQAAKLACLLCFFLALWEKRKKDRLEEPEQEEIEEKEIGNMLEYRFDTQLLIEGADLDEDDIDAYIKKNFKGDCLLVVGGDELVKLHYHTNEPWRVLEYCASLGDVYDIVVENMQRQEDGLQG